MTTKEQAKSTYDKFSFIEGNQHIAGQFAIETILNIVDKFNVQSILEVGLGIGSISDAVLNFQKLRNLKINYVGTESNEFCLNALKSNVVEYEKINIYHDITTIERNEKFELIIIDGTDTSIEKLYLYATTDAIIFIEGARGTQVEQIKKMFPNILFAHVVSDFKNSQNGPFSSDSWSGGGTLFFVNPNLSKKLYWLLQKIRTKYIYNKR